MANDPMKNDRYCWFECLQVCTQFRLRIWLVRCFVIYFTFIETLAWGGSKYSYELHSITISMEYLHFDRNIRNDTIRNQCRHSQWHPQTFKCLLIPYSRFGNTCSCETQFCMGWQRNVWHSQELNAPRH